MNEAERKVLVNGSQARFDRDEAQELDRTAAYPGRRDQFWIPQTFEARDQVYLTGNSLGLQPKEARRYVLEELDDWARFGVEGHVHARRPWVDYHSGFAPSLARIVGAEPEEVVAMNGLTANLHLMMVSFYRPQGSRRKILCEAKAFPSDLYAFESQIRFHGGAPTDLIALEPRPGEHLLRTEDIAEAIDRHRDELALLLLGGVNYYTGQWFEMHTLTHQARQRGIVVGWDLAHAAGNVPMQLHDWDVDFAVWCSYKYLNSGPGSVSGAYVHQRHHGQSDIPRFEGWWGHRIQNRFAMPSRFEPTPTAEAWQLSNAPVLSMAAHRAALDLFDEAGMDRLRARSLELTAYLEAALNKLIAAKRWPWRWISPTDPEQRGAQLSLEVGAAGRRFFDYLGRNGVVADWREPGVIRMAPAPLYNTFEDLAQLYSICERYEA
ncbi:kynureninase [bacterium]|nr:kynureninase [bacterium]